MLTVRFNMQSIYLNSQNNSNTQKRINYRKVLLFKSLLSKI